MERPVCIVTGANSGIGLEFTKRLLQFEYHIIIACRSKPKGEKAISELLKEHGREAKLDLMLLDLNSKTSIHQFVDSFLKKELRLDLLVNNAGIYLVNSQPLNEYGVEPTLFTNHYGPFLLTHLLLPKLKESGGGRIVNVSSSLHFRVNPEADLLDLNPISNNVSSRNIYPISKKCTLYTSAYLENNVLNEEDNIEIINVCPGFIPTTELAKEAGFLFQLAAKYILPLLPFTSTLDQGGNRLIISATSNLKGLYLERKSASTLFYQKEKFEWLEFDSEKAKQIYEQSMEVTGLNMK